MAWTPQADQAYTDAARAMLAWSPPRRTELQSGSGLGTREMDSDKAAVRSRPKDTGQCWLTH
ncbi:hypothetical protein ColTof4_14329 [Colletotrichum tofieldiae]|nr:hypothetical protein ColTof3_14739 [Colletotrichum tofieldiae]GKT81906.1 hypothetical protein ColTof4_14329 [Colletotrichum tofieldiae]